MKGLTELSSLFPVMFTARNFAADTYCRSDRHVALAAICRLLYVASRASVNSFHRLPLAFKYLSVGVAYDMSPQYERFLRVHKHNVKMALQRI